MGSRIMMMMMIVVLMFYTLRNTREPANDSYLLFFKKVTQYSNIPKTLLETILTMIFLYCLATCFKPIFDSKLVQSINVIMS